MKQSIFGRKKTCRLHARSRVVIPSHKEQLKVRPRTTLYVTPMCPAYKDFTLPDAARIRAGRGTRSNDDLRDPKRRIVSVVHLGLPTHCTARRRNSTPLGRWTVPYWKRYVPFTTKSESLRAHHLLVPQFVGMFNGRIRTCRQLQAALCAGIQHRWHGWLSVNFISARGTQPS